jgi:hypothetical protein
MHASDRCAEYSSERGLEGYKRRSAREQPAQKNQDSIRTRKRRHNHSYGDAIVIMASGPNPTKHHQQRPPRRYWQASIRPHFTEVLLAVALVAVGTAQVIIYLRQATIMETQAKISQRQLEETKIARRPWVTLDGDIGITQPLTFDDTGAHVSVTGIIKNGGGSIAKNVKLVNSALIAQPVIMPVNARVSMEQLQRSLFRGMPDGPSVAVLARQGPG